MLGEGERLLRAVIAGAAGAVLATGLITGGGGCYNPGAKIVAGGIAFDDTTGIGAFVPMD